MFFQDGQTMPELHEQVIQIVVEQMGLDITRLAKISIFSHVCIVRDL